VPGQHDHGGAEPQCRGAHGERGLQHQGGGNLIPAGEVMLDQEARAEAQRLGFDGVVEIVAEALPGLGAEVAAVGLHRAEDSELHCGSVLKIARLIKILSIDLRRYWNARGEMHPTTDTECTHDAA
jgi:hypothetical protein